MPYEQKAVIVALKSYAKSPVRVAQTAGPLFTLQGVVLLNNTPGPGINSNV
jgi:hypothetical protein